MSDDGMYVEPPEETTPSQASLREMMLQRVVPMAALGIPGVKQKTHDTKKDTITLVINAYHSSTEGGTESVEIRTMHQPLLHEQVYKRKTVMQPGTHKLNVGWIEDPGYVIIENKTMPDKPEATDDSEAEAAAVAESLKAWQETPPTIVFNDDWEIPPGDVFVGRVRQGAYLEMEIINGPVTISICAFPR